MPNGEEKRIQRAMLQYRDPRNYHLVKEGLKVAGRLDLMGAGRQCLIPSRSAGTRGWGQERKISRMKKQW